MVEEFVGIGSHQLFLINFINIDIGKTITLKNLKKRKKNMSNMFTGAAKYIPNIAKRIYLGNN